MKTKICKITGGCCDCKMTGKGLSPKLLKEAIDSSYTANKDISVPGYTVDTEFSNERVKVLVPDKKSGDVIVVHRGSADVSDWVDNAIYAKTGNVIKTKTFKIHKGINDKVIKKYGANKVILVGHSRAGLYVEELNKMNPVKEVITYNKAAGVHSFLQKNPKNQTDVRTNNDVVSLLTPFQRSSNKRVVINSGTYNPITAHGTDALSKYDSFIGLKNENENENDENDDELIGGGAKPKTRTLPELKKLLAKYQYQLDRAMDGFMYKTYSKGQYRTFGHDPKTAQEEAIRWLIGSTESRIDSYNRTGKDNPTAVNFTKLERFDDNEGFWWGFNKPRVKKLEELRKLTDVKLIERNLKKLENKLQSIEGGKKYKYAYEKIFTESSIKALEEAYRNSTKIIPIENVNVSESAASKMTKANCKKIMKINNITSFTNLKEWIKLNHPDKNPEMNKYMYANVIECYKKAYGVKDFPKDFTPESQAFTKTQGEYLTAAEKEKEKEKRKRRAEIRKDLENIESKERKARLKAKNYVGMMCDDDGYDSPNDEFNYGGMMGDDGRVPGGSGGADRPSRDLSEYYKPYSRVGQGKGVEKKNWMDMITLEVLEAENKRFHEKKKILNYPTYNQLTKARQRATRERVRQRLEKAMEGKTGDVLEALLSLSSDSQPGGSRDPGGSGDPGGSSSAVGSAYGGMFPSFRRKNRITEISTPLLVETSTTTSQEPSSSMSTYVPPTIPVSAPASAPASAPIYPQPPKLSLADVEILKPLIRKFDVLEGQRANLARRRFILRGSRSNPAVKQEMSEISSRMREIEDRRDREWKKLSERERRIWREHEQFKMIRERLLNEMLEAQDDEDDEDVSYEDVSYEDVSYEDLPDEDSYEDLSDALGAGLYGGGVLASMMKSMRDFLSGKTKNPFKVNDKLEVRYPDGTVVSGSVKKINRDGSIVISTINGEITINQNDIGGAIAHGIIQVPGLGEMPGGSNLPPLPNIILPSIVPSPPMPLGQPGMPPVAQQQIGDAPPSKPLIRNRDLILAGYTDEEVRGINRLMKTRFGLPYTPRTWMETPLPNKLEYTPRGAADESPYVLSRMKKIFPDPPPTPPPKNELDFMKDFIERVRSLTDTISQSRADMESQSARTRADMESQSARTRADLESQKESHTLTPSSPEDDEPPTVEPPTVEPPPTKISRDSLSKEISDLVSQIQENTKQRNSLEYNLRDLNTQYRFLERDAHEIQQLDVDSSERRNFIQVAKYVKKRRREVEDELGDLNVQQSILRRKLQILENEMRSLGAGLGGAWWPFRRRNNVPMRPNIPQAQTQIQIPNFELVVEDDTVPIGVPQPIGVPVNVYRGRNVRRATSNMPGIPEATLVPYSTTLNTINNEISVNTNLLADLERQRQEILRNPNSTARQRVRITQKINGLRNKLRLLTTQQNAGLGETLIQSSQTLDFPRDYRPPGGFADAGDTPRR